MRLLALLLLFVIAGCGEAPDETLRLVTVESQDSHGLSLRELPQATLYSIGLRYGLAVIRLGAAAERAGLRLGDVGRFRLRGRRCLFLLRGLRSRRARDRKDGQQDHSFHSAILFA